ARCPPSEPSPSKFHSAATASFPRQKLLVFSGSESNLDHNSSLSRRPWTRPLLHSESRKKIIPSLLTLRWRAAADARVLLAGAKTILQIRTSSACRKNWSLCHLLTLVPWRPTSFSYTKASFREEDRATQRSQASPYGSVSACRLRDRE